MRRIKYCFDLCKDIAHAHHITIGDLGRAGTRTSDVKCHAIRHNRGSAGRALEVKGWEQGNIPHALVWVVVVLTMRFSMFGI